MYDHELNCVVEEITNNIKNEVNKIKKIVNTVRTESYQEGYNRGYDLGFKKGSELKLSDISIDDIDMNSIKIFAEFCYLHGIDFSYMAKATDTVPFEKRVLDKFNTYLKINTKNN